MNKTDCVQIVLESLRDDQRRLDRAIVHLKALAGVSMVPPETASVSPVALAGIPPKKLWET